MQKSIKVVLLGIIILILGGCVNDRQPITPQFNSGMKKTKEWVSYNKEAKLNGQAILDLVSTSLKKPAKKSKILNFNQFNIDDKELWITTKWHNVKKDDLVEFRIYQPDGRLYYYGYVAYKWNSNKWTVWRKLPLEKYYAVKNPGKWKIDISLNDKKAVSKYFIIGSDIKVEKVTTNKVIGVFPYFDSELNRWKHSMWIPYHLSTGLLYKNKNLKTIPPRLILKDLAIPATDYKSFESYIKNDLNSAESIIINSANEHNMDYVILGKVESKPGSTLDTEVVSYIVDVKSKKIIHTRTIRDMVTRGEINIATKWLDKRKVIYEKSLNDIQPIIAQLP